MQATPPSHPDILLITPPVYGDARGFFLDSYDRRRFAALGVDADFVQDKHSRSTRHVLRGLHYQVCQPQGKLVRVIQGVVFDVAVDLRRSSPRFGEVCTVTLDADTPQLLWIPPGFAHGFLVLSGSAEFSYKTTDYYAPEHERCIAWDDPTLAIPWPLTAPPVLSDKDRRGQRFVDGETYP
jgi:dTDP-4-dehydrorhamnose 3,5-epimerase